MHILLQFLKNYHNPSALLLFSVLLQVFAETNRQEQKIKAKWIGKEEIKQLPLIDHTMYLYGKFKGIFK